LSVATPSGVAAGDVLVAAVAVRPHTVSVTPPSGWTLVRRLDNSGGAGNSLLVYTRVAGTGEPASHGWTFSTTTGMVSGIVAFRFVDTSSIVAIENGQTTASSVSHATPSVTTPVANTMLVTVHSFSSSATWTPPTGMTEAVDVTSQAIGSVGIALEMNHELQAAAAATGAKTAVASNDADTGNTVILALRRAP